MEEIERESCLERGKSGGSGGFGVFYEQFVPLSKNPRFSGGGRLVGLRERF